MALNIITAQVVGVRSYSFTGREGSPIIMAQVYCMFEDKNTEGKACCSVNMTEIKLTEQCIGVGAPIHVCLVNKRWEYVGV